MSQMGRKSKKKKWAQRAELKVRLPEPLRLNLELEARRAGRSMNAEAVWRLSESVLGNRDAYSIAAEAILNGLDERIVTIIEDMILRANAEKEVRALYRKGAEEDLPSGELSDPVPRTPDEARRTLYENARAGLIEQLRSADPPLSEVQITRVRLALEDAIRKVDPVRKAGAEPRPGPLGPRAPTDAPTSDREPELPMPHQPRRHLIK